MLKHSVIKGANSNVVVRHWLQLKPGAVIVRWWSSFIRMETGHIFSWHWLYFLLFLTLSVWAILVSFILWISCAWFSQGDAVQLISCPNIAHSLPHYFRMSVSVYLKSYPLSLVVCRRRFCRHLGCTSLKHNTSGCCLLSFSYHPRAVTGSSCCYHCNFQSLLKP